MSEPNYAIQFTEGERTGEAYALELEEITLGRSRSNQISLQDSGLSRKHLSFRAQEDEVLVEDLGSTHGSFLNGKRLRGIVSLHVGDEIILGSQTVKFVKLDEVMGQDGVTLVSLQPNEGEVDAASEDEVEHDLTRFAGEGEIQETRYHALDDVAKRDDDDDEEHTRDLIDQHTRMLDAAELQGLRPGRVEDKGSKKLMVGLVGIIALVVIGAFFAYQVGGEKEPEEFLRRYMDEQYAFQLRYPATWFKETGSGSHVISFEEVEADITKSYMRIYIDENPEHALLGLTHGFEAYKEEKARLYDDVKFGAPKKMVINHVPVLFYGFVTPHQRGRGIFTIVDNRRYDVETVALEGHFPAVAKLLPNLLKKFELEDQEIVIDYPLPDGEQRRMALGQPDRLAKLAEDKLEVARVLMLRRKVRPENMYRSVETCQMALQMASALGTRPPYFEKAAKRLAEATMAYNDMIRQTKFRIRVAEKEKDWQAVYWEANKLMQLVPDKTDPDYQMGYKKAKAYERKLR